MVSKMCHLASAEYFTINKMADNQGIFGLLQDVFGAFVDGFNGVLPQNLYGDDQVLDESDVDIMHIFRLFKDPERLLAEFVAYNKKHYRQDFTDPLEFINVYFKASSYTQLHQKSFKKKQFVYLFGIPVLLVEHLPWDDPNDDFVLHGCYNPVGIVCRESSEILDTVLHELIHSVIHWLKLKGKFKLPQKKVKKISTSSKDPTILQLYEVVNLLTARINPVNADTITTRFRDEVISYLMGSPGSLAKASTSGSMKYLTGKTREVVSKHFGDYIVELDQLIEVIVSVDKGKGIIRKENLCLIMLANVTTAELIIAINKTFKN
jgi:hypothetical protein